MTMIDWTSMTETARERQLRSRTFASHGEVQGIRNALKAAFNDNGNNLPEEFRRLLAKLG